MEITAEIIAAFRRYHSGAFCNASWPDEQVRIHLCDGDTETGGCGWGKYEDKCGNFKGRGMFLYAAHSLSLVSPGGITGRFSGATPRNVVSSRSVGDESTSFAVPTPDSASSSWLASTGYGQQFMMLRRRAGMGAIAL